MLPEVQSYIERLGDRRAEILKAIDGLDEAALDWTPLPGEANSLAVLAVHSLGAERNWLHGIVGQKKIERDREAEFRARAEDLSTLKAMYAAAALTTEQILASLTEQELDSPRWTQQNRPVKVRWAILHVLEHYSEHLAQIWLTRQLYENRKTA